MNKLYPFNSFEGQHKLAGIGLFIVAIIISGKHYPPFGIPYDGAFYIAFARNLSKNITDFSYQSIYMMFRPPVYSYTLAILYKFLPYNTHILAARVVSSVFYAGTAVMIYLLFRKYLGDLASMCASIFYILNPIAMAMSILPLVHSEFTFFYLITMYWLLRWSKETHTRNTILFGIFSGVAILTRYTGLTIWVITIVYLYFLIISNKLTLSPVEIAKHLFLAISTTLLVMSPWMIMGKLYYGGFLNPFIVASAEVNLNAAKIPVGEYLADVIRTLGIPATILAIAGGIYFMFQRTRVSQLILSWETFGTIGILLILHKEVRFITFLTPVIAILSANGVKMTFEIITKLLKKSRKQSGKRVAGLVTTAILLCAWTTSYLNAKNYTENYYYSGATQARVLEKFKTSIEANDNNIYLLVSPNLYPYAGLYLPDAEVYQMSSYDINWLVHGIHGPIPNVSTMISKGTFDYILYCESSGSGVQRWIQQIKRSNRYALLAELFEGKCKILKTISITKTSP